MSVDMSKWCELAKANIHKRPAGEGRMAGKICIVTGAAQGFGKGIAEELYKEGATIVIADMNEPLAKQVAEAYAGSKFGGIGLTQSFALELCAYNIKVNAVCPGNFLDGPLWSDPVRGLFVQYLAAGKVPGAKTVEDVRRYYEAKVPMNRGCMPLDVARAVMYCVEQKYETGQAIPVTGGQVMLN